MNLNFLHHYWFGEISLTENYYEAQIPRWFFNVNPVLDLDCRRLFARGLKETFNAHSAQEHLALILLYDQVPRNAFRGTSEAYEFDSHARELSFKLIEAGFENELSLPERIFLYMPFQHAENLELQKLSVEKFKELHRLAPPEIQQWTELGVHKAIEHYETILEHGFFPGRRT